MSTSVKTLLQPWTETAAVESDTPKKHTILLQPWTEHERGWGSRPDGGTAHLTTADFQAFFNEYKSKLPKEVPDEYSVPDGTPVVVQVKEELYDQVAKSKNGIWIAPLDFNKLVRGGDGS